MHFPSFLQSPGSQEGESATELKIDKLRERSKMLRFNTERPRKSSTESPLKKKVAALSSPSKVAAMLSPLSNKGDGKITKTDDEDKDAIEMGAASGGGGAEEDSSTDHRERPNKMQARPLPALPESCISTSPSSSPQMTKDTEVVLASGDGDNGSGAYASLISPDHYMELTAVSAAPPSSSTLLLPKNKRNSSASNYLTMTGTIKRGPNSKRPRYPPSSARSFSAASDVDACERSPAHVSKSWTEEEEEVDPVYDVQMNLTAEGLRAIEKRVHDKYHDRCFCGLRRGPHIFLISLLFVPFMLIYGTLSAFYFGTLTWYSIFVSLNEDRGCCGKLASPFFLLLYPLWIVPVTLILGLYGVVAQISWYWDSWLSTISAPDGGFFGWFCNWIGEPECAPYQIILLTARDYERPSVLHGAAKL